MKNRDIFQMAMGLIGEPFDQSEPADYLARSSYILACFFYENESLDRDYRRLLGFEGQGYFHAVYTDIDGEFPFSERFSSCAAHYLGAMLVLEERKELADSLYDKYCECISSIISEIPVKCESISDVY